MNFENIDTKKKQLDALRPFPEHSLKSLRENLIVEWTYNSNAIEGNTLTLQETKVVLEDGITIGGKSLREHLEATNHRDAILYVEDIVKNREPFSEWLIKRIHKLILQKIDDKNAGQYRNENVVISGAKHIPPDFLQVPGEMEQLVQWYETEGKQLHPAELAAHVHSIFVRIHPFVDGNGRTARLLLNLELMKYGFPPIVIKNENRLAYYNALDKAHTENDPEDFIQLVVDTIEQTLDFYLKVLRK